MKKLRVAVVMGGKSSEYEISLKTGAEVIKNLNQGKYQILPIIIPNSGDVSQLFGLRGKTDIVFIAMHGAGGEDGKIQGFLEMLDIPYTGSGILPSAIGMDKLVSRNLFIQAGLTVPEYVVVRKGQNEEKVWKSLQLPLFVHPHNQGSAIGSNIVKTKQELEKALINAHNFSDIALVEEYLKGTEITCAILGNGKLTTLPIIEIRPKREFFDYEAKYNPKLCNELCPAPISRKLTDKAQKAALHAYETIGCQVFGRVDMIIVKDKIYVLEVNTIPGLTPVSLFPKAAKAAGTSYAALLDKIINASLEHVN